jgi:phage terminase large subunit-like protein
LFVVAAWEKPAGSRGDGWIVPREQVTATVDRAMRDYDVQVLACDPPGWHREIDEWSERYATVVTLMYPPNRRTLMSDACSKFYTAVVNQTLTHDGDPTLARHLANAMVKETPDGAYITKEHRASPRKIDAAVAAVVAYDRATSYVPKRKAVLVTSNPW